MADAQFTLRSSLPALTDAHKQRSLDMLQQLHTTRRVCLQRREAVNSISETGVIEDESFIRPQPDATCSAVIFVWRKLGADEQHGDE